MLRYFFPNFDPLPLSHFVTHLGTPRKYITHLGPPIFSRPSTKSPDKSPLYKFSLNYSWGFLSGNFDPLPLSHFVTHPGTPESTSHILDPPFLVGLVQKNRTKAPCKNFLNYSWGFLPGGIFVRGLLCGRFCPGWFCSFPLLSEYICYNRKLNITLDFMFHMYDIYKCDVTCYIPLPSVTNCQTFSDPSPLERDVLYGRPLIYIC